MARVYATPAEYAEWLGVSQPPTGADRALRSASRVVDRALLTAIYEADEQGFPIDLGERQAVRDATCAQAEAARAAGDPDGIGAAPLYEGVTIGSVQLTRAKGTDGGPGRLGTDIARAAWDVLQQAGLTGGGPWST